MNLILIHHGIKGQKWGIRRYQNPDGTLTNKGKAHYQKADEKFVNKKSDKIYNKAKKQSEKEMSKFVKKEMSGMTGRTAINTYNKQLAKVMRTKTTDIRSPSGKIIEWVAKRGEVGVYMALADQGYNMQQLKNGVWNTGRVGYKTETVNMQEGGQS